MNDNRRNFLRKMMVSLVSLSAFSSLSGIFVSAFADDFPLVTKDDPMAKAVNYEASTKKKDKCVACALYTAIDKKKGKCQLFAGKSVTAGGWCSSFVAKK